MMGHSIDECCKKGMLHGTLRDLHNLPVASQYRSMWHCSSKELEANSPSRTDGINWETESQLRISYCSFIQNMGIELGVPQLTIATAIMLCHRFYLRQSHAKNDWQTVATACIFLAAKIEETPCFLDKVVVMSYRMKHRKDPSAAQRIKLKEVFLKQKELILIGENLLLSTVNFDLNIHHPYKPLAAAIRKLKLKDEVPKVAWNFVNDWLRTTLCLQYKPHYIAAGSLYLAAKLYNVQLPSEKGCVWWQEFDINPRMLEVVVHQMMATLGYKKSFVDPMVVALTPHTKTPVVAKEALSSSPASCVLSHASSSACSSPMFDDLNGGDRKAVDNDHHRSFISAVKNVSASEKSEIQLQRPDSKSCPRSVIGNCEGQTKTEIHSLSRNDDVSLRNASFVIDKERIREKIKRRRWERQSGKVNAADYTSEDSLERDLESVILVPETEPARKLQKV